MDTGSRVRGPQKNVSPHVWTTHRYGLLASSSRYTTQYPLFILSKAQSLKLKKRKKKKKKVKNLLVVPFSMLLAGVAGYASTFSGPHLNVTAVDIVKKTKTKITLTNQSPIPFLFLFWETGLFLRSNSHFVYTLILNWIFVFFQSTCHRSI